MQRLCRWQRLHHEQGPGRSYPHAWRLPDLARPLGQTCLQSACYALALDLYTLGRFREALNALPEVTEASSQFDRERISALRRRTRLVLASGDTDDGAATGLEQAELAYLQGRPDLWPQWEHGGRSESDESWFAMLRTWRMARLGRPVELTDCHAAAARLRRLNPVSGALAEAVLGEILYWHAPRWAPVWLDQALLQVEAFSQHHLKARLLGLKACALEAAGALAEGARFRKLARNVAQRQQAQLYLRRFIEPPDDLSRP